jgi:isopentenyl diphosphate isomerase/L-lactate dehydrogenase-like FMN-dependent dehydrogenase
MSEPRPTDSNRITREYFDSMLLEMRHIGAVLPDTRMTLFGHKFATPVMTAALSHLNNLRDDGMVELARGAAMAGAVMWCGMGDEGELERVTATGAKTVKIIKPYADNDYIIRRIKHAEACGCIAVGIDIDHAYSGRGGYDTVLGSEMRGKTVNDLIRFVHATKLPFVIKGVLSVTDARQCLDADARGVVVSHHHGIMDSAVPPLYVLPEIVNAVSARQATPVFVDCCVENGQDVFKALALGATAVSVGRALMGPLAEAGAEGVRDKLLEITAGLAGTMARTAAKDIGSIDASVIRFKPY